MGIVHAKSLQQSNIVQPEWKPLNEVPAHVDKVHFDGIQRTQEDVLQKAVTELSSVQNFQEIVLKAHDVKKQLESLQIFKSIDIILDVSRGPDASPDGYEVTFDVKERPRIAGNINVLAGNNEGSLLFRFLFPNMFGRGEALTADYQYGKKTVGFSILSTKPYLTWTKPRINGIIFGHTSDYPWSGYQEKAKGLATEILFESSPQVQHTLRYEGIWRNLKCLSSSTPFDIRLEAGHNLKSCVKHILCMDQRNDNCLPSRGSYFRLYQEYAGLGGNISFLKHEIQYQINKSIFNDIVLQATLMGGFLRTLGPEKAISISDKFFLGGPLSVRGFALNGIGPHINDYSLGAEVYWASAVHAYAPLPFRPLRQALDKVCRTHIFFNAGNIGNFAFTDDYHYNSMLLLSNLRCSCGFGLVLSLAGIARFELNYCWPLSSQPSDRVIKGLQFGIGVNFL